MSVVGGGLIGVLLRLPAWLRPRRLLRRPRARLRHPTVGLRVLYGGIHHEVIDAGYVDRSKSTEQVFGIKCHKAQEEIAPCLCKTDGATRYSRPPAPDGRAAP